MENIKFEVDPKKIQAFPDEYNEGMTLRDYFAAKAMQGFISDEEFESPEWCAEFSYRMADAMLEARSK